MKQFAILLAFIAIILLAIWYEMEVWDECRQTNSFMYCMRVLSK